MRRGSVRGIGPARPGRLLPLHALPAAHRHRRRRFGACAGRSRGDPTRRRARPRVRARGRRGEVLLLGLRRRALEPIARWGGDARDPARGRSTPTRACGQACGSTSPTPRPGRRSRTTGCPATRDRLLLLEYGFAMCFDTRLRAAGPGDRRRGRLARRPRAEGRRRKPTSPRSSRSPTRRPASGVVILPDVRGLYHFYEELALRFAERGHAALALDYFGRTAGTAKRDDEFEYPPHVEQTTDAGVQADTRAAVDAPARARLHVDLHGRLLLRRARVVGRRGVGPRARGRDRLLRQPDARARRPECRRARAARSRARSWRSRQATTPDITAEDNAAFEDALTGAGVEHEIVVYDGAPHSFFDRKQADFADASDDAWQTDARVRRAARLILAIDQGTTGTTCLLVDEESRVLGRGYQGLPQTFPGPGLRRVRRRGDLGRRRAGGRAALARRRRAPLGHLARRDREPA